MKKEEYIINLDLPPAERWAFLVDYKEEIDELLECYLNDFREAELIFESIGGYKEQLISSEYLEEIEFISSISKFNANEVLIANLYYDLLKFYFGCTAFAFEGKEGIIHSRNLDWHTENNLLSEHSKVFDFRKGGQTLFKTVGWVGFVGALSGVKPGKFSLTLNAVLSNDKPEIATPISFLLRDVLASANSFEEAREKLEKTTIICDCLLLLSGTNSGEMAVIERTPKRFATRWSEEGIISVTNDYKKLENHVEEDSLLQSTSCDRYDRALQLLREGLPANSDECLKILQDEKIMMGITVQQMVFDNQTGEVTLIKVTQ